VASKVTLRVVGVLWRKQNLSSLSLGRGFNASHNVIPVQNLIVLTHVERAGKDEKQQNLKVILV
jgi:hypothetical protein